MSASNKLLTIRPAKKRLPSLFPFRSAPRIPATMSHSGRLPQPVTGSASLSSCWQGSQHRLAASPIREEVPGVKPVLTSPSLLPHLGPQDFLLCPMGAAPEEILARIGPIWSPPAPSSELLLRPHEALAAWTVTRLRLAEPCSQPLVGARRAEVRHLTWLPESAPSLIFHSNLTLRPSLPILLPDLCD